MSSLRVLRAAGSRYWYRAVLWTIIGALMIGIPTVLIPNALFRRMTPIRWWDFVFWIIASALAGMLLAARALPETGSCPVEGRTMAGGGLAYLAVACPICNKIIVALLGVSGALTYFAPLQPALGFLSVAILAWTLRRRLATAAPAILVRHVIDGGTV